MLTSQNIVMLGSERGQDRDSHVLFPTSKLLNKRINANKGYTKKMIEMDVYKQKSVSSMRHLRKMTEENDC